MVLNKSVREPRREKKKFRVIAQKKEQVIMRTGPHQGGVAEKKAMPA